MKKIYIDVETSGTNPAIHGILQIAGKVKIDGEIMETFNFDVQPFTTDVIEQGALDVNGVRMEDLFSNDRLTPTNAYTVLSRVLAKYIDKFNKTDKAIFVAYNAPFDDGFMRAFFSKNNDKYYGSYFYTPAMCIMNKAMDYLQDCRGELENFKLTTVARFLGIGFDDQQAHEALFDIDLAEKIETIIDGERLKLLTL